MGTCQPVLHVPGCLFNPWERLDWPCKRTFTIICGTAPRLAVFFLTNIKKDAGVSGSYLSVEILSPHYHRRRKAHLTLVGLPLGEKMAVLAQGILCWRQCLHCCLWLTNNALNLPCKTLSHLSFRFILHNSTFKMGLGGSGGNSDELS